MIGPTVILRYQEKTDVSDGQGGFTTTWRDIADFKGNFQESIREAGVEKFKNDKKQNEDEFIFIIDYPLRTTIGNNARFYQSSTSLYYEVINVDNVAFLNKHLEIRLRKIV